tara:strand:- start:89 stop:901 length:813 start_codon:yes stop_codon:yes gene_type:complete
MLSSADTLGVWIHDENESRNSFYGEASPSSITVVSNADPSAVKLYKAISLETNKKDWEAAFSTNEEHNDSNRQKSSITTGFEDKEGFKYRDIPRSSLNSTSHLVPFPSVSLSDFTQEQIQSDVDNLNYIVAFEIEIDNPPFDLSIPGGEIFALHQGQLKSFRTLFLETADSGLSNVSTILLQSCNNEFVTIATNLWVTTFLTVEEYVAALENFISHPLFIASSVSENGDQMRGPYLKTDLLINTDEPLELHAINIDYEFSKLDKRLTQNS